MKFRHIFLLLVLLSAVFSYFYSRELYQFYMKTYYLTIKKETPERAAEKAWSLYKNKDYDSLREYIPALMFLFPEDNRIRRVAGLFYIDEGKEEEGARLLLRSLEDMHDRRLLGRSIEVLFREKLYGDIVDELSRFSIEDDLQLTYVRGVSYYELGRYREALRSLQRSERLGNRTVEVYYHLALTFEKLQNYTEAIRSLSRARELNPMDAEVKRLLIRLYRRDGQLDRAERLLRRSITRK